MEKKAYSFFQIAKINMQKKHEIIFQKKMQKKQKCKKKDEKKSRGVFFKF